MRGMDIACIRMRMPIHTHMHASQAIEYDRASEKNRYHVENLQFFENEIYHRRYGTRFCSPNSSKLESST